MKGINPSAIVEIPQFLKHLPNPEVEITNIDWEKGLW